MYREHNGKYYLSTYNTISKFPIGVYSLKFSHKEHDLEFTPISTEYKIPSTVYFLDNEFINRCVNKFNNNGNKNLGILTTGLKGTGKTLTCKVISNKLKLPVIVFSEKVLQHNLNAFIAGLEQDVIFFIDEYDKLYGLDDDLLAIMDGAIKSKHKILFLLTSNKMDINENLINRPSRIFYIKHFYELTEEQIKEILHNEFEDQNLIDSILTIVLNFQNVTIDNLCTFISEIKGCDNDAEAAIKYLNIPMKEKKTNFGLNRK